MNKINLKIVTYLLAFLLAPTLVAQQTGSNYHDVGSVNNAFKSLHEKHKTTTKLHEIAVSSVNNKVYIFEIGSNLQAPAIFIAANLEGNTPIGTEAALFLSNEILSKEITNKWYILYNGNPDAAMNFFSAVKNEDSRNRFAVNDDKDEATDEDPMEDLNKDGLITLMRVPDPLGEYLEDKSVPGLMRKADKLKGEKGMYRIMSEGIDNDKDGYYNEDPIGGINLNENFPHQFQHFTKTGGEWPGSSPEVYGVIKFVYEHPDIVMAITFGNNDFLKNMPKKSKRGIDTEHIKLSRRMAGRMGLDATKSYSMDELKQLAQEAFPQRSISTSWIASMAGLGEVVETFPADLDYFNVISKSYKKFLGRSAKTTQAESIEDGGFEKWAYYHLGIPSFAINLWNTPLAKDTTIRKDLINDASVIVNSSELLNGGFIAWKKYNHPQLGEVEIGGTAPFALNNPPADKIQASLEKKVPFVFELVKNIPNISILKTQLNKISEGYYEAEVWVNNDAYLPWPLFIARWNGQQAPIILEISGKNTEILKGKARTAIEYIDGNSSIKFSWMVKTSSPNSVTVKLSSEQGWSDSKSFKL